MSFGSRLPVSAAVSYTALTVSVAAVALTAGHALAYDPTSWQIWAGEIVHGHLSTAGGGPAWKPLPVAVAAVAMPFGRDAGVMFWLLFVRVAALLGVAAAGALGGRIAGASGRVGALLVTLVLLLGHWGKLVAAGMSEPVCAAAMLVATYAFVARRRWLTVVACLLAALIRPEAWVFLIAAALWCCARAHWRRCDMTVAVALLALVPAGWFGPDWVFSGDPLRSLHRAQQPTSGGPLLTAHPGLAVLHEAVIGLGLPLLIAAGIGLLVARGPVQQALLTVTAAGAGWILLDVLLVQAHLDSGDARYLLPGTSLVAVAAGVAPAALLVRRRAPEGNGQQRTPAIVVAAVAALVVATPWLWLRSAVAGWQWQQRESRSTQELAALTSGPLFRNASACGRLMTGGYQVPLVAWQLGLPINAVQMPADQPGVILAEGGQPAHIPSNFAVLTRAGARTTGWTLWARREGNEGRLAKPVCRPGARVRPSGSS